jgi:nitrogen permease regulator 2-like protein
MEDLNNYCECMIPIDELNTLNIKLFPTLPNPVSVKDWYVPLFTVRIETLVDENWDLTMLRIIPFINGVNSVKKIASLADADVKLTRKCVKHLLYYGCVILLDIFSFNAIYAPTAEFSNLIVKDQDMQRECARYINTAFSPSATSKSPEEALVIDERRTSNLSTPQTINNLNDEDIFPLTSKGVPIDGVTIIRLYANLRQGTTVREWYTSNAGLLVNIDIRRFITFGVIKGFLYRVHRYALRTPRSLGSSIEAFDQQQHDHDGHAGKRRSTNPDTTRKISSSATTRAKSGDSLTENLISYLDGTHCFDEICTALAISEKSLISTLQTGGKEMGEVTIICR